MLFVSLQENLMLPLNFAISFLLKYCFENAISYFREKKKPVVELSKSFSLQKDNLFSNLNV